MQNDDYLLSIAAVKRFQGSYCSTLVAQGEFSVLIEPRRCARTAAVGVIFFLSTYLYQKKLNIPFQNDLLGFVCFLFLFQAVQSTAALQGYRIWLLHGKGEWK